MNPTTHDQFLTEYYILIKPEHVNHKIYFITSIWGRPHRSMLTEFATQNRENLGDILRSPAQPHT